MQGSLKTPTRLDPFGMECEWNDRRILATCSVGNGRMQPRFHKFRLELTCKKPKRSGWRSQTKHLLMRNTQLSLLTQLSVQIQQWRCRFYSTIRTISNPSSSSHVTICHYGTTSHNDVFASIGFLISQQADFELLVSDHRPCWIHDSHVWVA